MTIAAKKFAPLSAVAAIQSVIDSHGQPVPLHEPKFGGNEWLYLKECLDTGWVSSVGAFVDRFEKDIASYTGVQHAIAVVNGTAALHLCLMGVGAQLGDEILVPSLTFVATANAVSYCGATPHFVDIDELTLGIDPRKLGDYLSDIAEIRGGEAYNRFSGRRLRSVVAMHTFGHPVDLDHLSEVCRQFRIELIEDAAESLGSYYKGRHTGNWGRVSALSFNGNKILTTGGGGAVLTNDDELGRRLKHLSTTARVPHRWSFIHDAIGYNYRLPNLNAALGCAQLEQLDRFLLNKRQLAAAYIKAFSGIQGIRVFTEPPFSSSNYWLNSLLLDSEFSEQRDTLLEFLNSAGICARPAWRLMHMTSMYENCPRMSELKVSEEIERRLINIPSSPGLVAEAV